MKKFIKNKPLSPTFSQEGLDGFIFDLEDKDLEFYFIDCYKGHDDFVITESITHIYYVLEGGGVFAIRDTEYEVRKGGLIEIPPQTKFTYKGKMKLLMVMNPPFSDKDVKIIKD